MSERTWNLGLDDAVEGAPINPRFATDPDYAAGYAYGEPDDEEPACWSPELPGPPEPSVEELCAAYGHTYHGDDSLGGRCYCGEVRYPGGQPRDR